jgi:ankyrin repeat protein
MSCSKVSPVYQSISGAVPRAGALSVLRELIKKSLGTPENNDFFEAIVNHLKSNPDDAKEKNLFMFVFRFPNNDRVVRLLIAHGALSSEAFNLAVSSRHSSFKLVESLWLHGAVLAPTGRWSPLKWAIINGARNLPFDDLYEIVQHLIVEGRVGNPCEDVNYIGDDIKTAIQYAVENNANLPADQVNQIVSLFLDHSYPSLAGIWDHAYTAGNAYNNPNLFSILISGGANPNEVMKESAKSFVNTLEADIEETKEQFRIDLYNSLKAKFPAVFLKDY